MESSSHVLMICMAMALSSLLAECTVSYDNKAIIINGERRILLSGSIHYPRSTPDMWEDLVRKAKRGGLDVIDTYVFWNLHEPSPGNYDFEGNYDLVRFVKTIQKVGLYVHLRIGPYVCAEWNFGGFPVWLKHVPGISFRTDNEPFKREMQRFTQTIVALMKSENLFASQGGPIILSQVENEYGKLARILGQEGQNYMTWAAKMAVELNTGVPWVMCKETDAPDPVINTCNGFYCDEFSPNQVYKPTIWTEAWSGWFHVYGLPRSVRLVEDLAFAVAQFVQKGGSFVNYYMYHGGTNFGRTAGGPFVATSYDYDAPIDEYGLPREPKYSHLKYLHRSIKMCERALISTNPVISSLGPLQQAFVYYSEGGCAAFLSNNDMNSTVRILFDNRHYTLPPHSISILPDCRNVVFNTAKVSVQTSQMKMLPTDKKLSWQMYEEDIISENDVGTFSFRGLLDHVNVTRDSSDYLWYYTSVIVSESELKYGQFPTLIVESTSHALHVYLNGQFLGSAFGTRESRRSVFIEKIKLQVGINKLALLSVVGGLPNSGLHFESWSSGIYSVMVDDLDGGKLDLSQQKWSYKVGLKGESMNLATPNGFSYVEWASAVVAYNPQQPVWYKAHFDAPDVDAPLALDMTSMGKGQVWVNGRSIGRYWLATAIGTCKDFTYAETYRPQKFQTGCGQPTQRWYHMPQSWLKPTQNLLVVFEEVGGDTSGISIVERTLTNVCGNVAEYHPKLTSLHTQAYRSSGMPLLNPRVGLRCGPLQTITSIRFASFGTPLGTCGSFLKGSCHAPASLDVLREKCIGRRKCSVTVSVRKFGEDPCPDTLKRLAVEAICGP